MPSDDLPGDLQRPLDESMPPALLRPAVPPGPIPPDLIPPDPVPPDPVPPDRGVSGLPDSAPADSAPSDSTDTALPDTTPPHAPVTTDTAPPGPGVTGAPTGTIEAAGPTAASSQPVGDPTGQPPAPTAVPHLGVDSHVRAGAWTKLVRLATIPPRLAGDAVRSAAGWSTRPAGRLILPGALIAVLVGVAGMGGTVLVPTMGAAGPATPAPSAAPPGLPAVPTAPPAVGPSGPPATDRPETGVRADALRGWAEPLSPRTGIPVIALQAYGYAELVLARTNPGCQLSWTTLAAIGRVESNHGRAGGARLLADGRALPAIIGAPLDGGPGRELIPDTDDGELDGDREYDRAVGPMQFIPETWQREAVDATGDGEADIHNINDAALAAANYLCRHGGDLSSPEGWWRAVLAYNNVQAYAEAVFDAADDYGRRSRA